MFSKNKFLSLLIIFASVCVITACSSSTSSSGGSGQIPTGIYAGVFNGQTNIPSVTSTRAQLSISLPVAADGTFDGTAISGTLAITGGDRCFEGGTIDGSTYNGNQMTLTITTLAAEVITMTGTVTNDSYNGTFTADDTNCPGLTGGFEFSRG